jgi:hypothetical protein
MIRLREAVIAHFHTFVQQSRMCVKPFLSGTSYASFVHSVIAMQKNKDCIGTLSATIPFCASEESKGSWPFSLLCRFTVQTKTAISTLEFYNFYYIY